MHQLKSELSLLYDEWSFAYEQALSLKQEILPLAIESYQMAQASYKDGKFDYLALLDARNTLFDVEQQLLDALADYHHKRAEALRLTYYQSALCSQEPSQL